MRTHLSIFFNLALLIFFFLTQSVAAQIKKDFDVDWDKHKKTMFFLITGEKSKQLHHVVLISEQNTILGFEQPAKSESELLTKEKFNQKWSKQTIVTLDPAYDCKPVPESIQTFFEPDKDMNVTIFAHTTYHCPKLDSGIGVNIKIKDYFPQIENLKIETTSYIKEYKQIGAGEASFNLDFEIFKGSTD